MSETPPRRRIRTYAEVEKGTGSELLEQVLAQRGRLGQRLAGVRRVVPVLSGKGGVGKSAVTANLAAALAASGRRVGALDADLNGPSLARMLAARGPLGDGPGGISPARGVEGVGVVSMELLQGESDAPLRWREPSSGGWLWQSSMETGALREFLSDVAWGALDVLLVDVPPGTDKIARLLELVPSPHRALLVTTPSEAARAVVARSARQLREAAVDVGLVANMTAWVCPDCGSSTDLFPAAGAERLADETGLPLLARIPFDPRFGADTDAGRPFVLERPDQPAARALWALADALMAAEPAAAGAPLREEP